MYVDAERLERRCLPSAELRIDPESPKITGYAAVFDTWTDIGGWFKESIRPGAFRKTIKENDIRALIDHESSLVLGRNKSGTLKLREDSKGLAVEIDPPDTSYATDLLKSMKRGDINQMSFGFIVNKAEVDHERDERVLTDVTLFDVSVVTFPAYPTTSAEVRSAFEKRKQEKAEEPCGFSELDRIVRKIKAGESLTEEEQRVFAAFVPSLSVPPAQHTETPPEPPAKHSAGDTRENGQRWITLIAEVDKHYARRA